MLDPIYFGCDAKINASSLKKLTGNIDYSFLCQDSGIVEESLRGTTDTLYQSTESIDNFLSLSFKHCANDLWCSGTKVKYAFLNLGLVATIDETSFESINESLKKILAFYGTKLINCHTYYSEVCVASWTLLGTGNELVPMPTSGKLGLYLSGHLGFGYLLQNGCQKTEQLLLNRSAVDWFHSFSQVYEGTSDVSGFGLVGNLIALCEKFKCEISLDLEKITISSEIESLVTEKGLSCSAKQNIRSFSNFLKPLASDVQNQILFGGEVNGPILIVSELHENGENEAGLIGYVHPNSVNKIRFLGA